MLIIMKIVNCYSVNDSDANRMWHSCLANKDQVWQYGTKELKFWHTINQGTKQESNNNNYNRRLVQQSQKDDNEIAT